MERALNVPAKNRNDPSENHGHRVEANLEKVKHAASDLAQILLVEDSRPINRQFGEALRTLTVPSADQELRLQRLAQLTSKASVSVGEFCMAIGVPVTSNTDSKQLGTLVECCLALLSLTIDDEIEVVQNGGVEPEVHIPTGAEARDQLLLHFASSGGGAVDEIRNRFDWEKLLGESLETVIAGMKTSGVLVPVEGAKYRILYRKKAQDLVKLCDQHGLSGFGTIDGLAERLATIDPAGSAIGYPGELLMCSPEARRSLAKRLRQRDSEERGNDATDESVIEPGHPFETRPREQLDLRKPQCPYCSQTLSKIPGRKTKCPNCGRPMFVRTRPEDGARVVVTQEEADRIEYDWSIVTSATDPDFSYLTSSEEVEREREALITALSDSGQQKVLDDDVKWALLNKISHRYAITKQWGDYRNVELSKAEFLVRRCKFSAALKHYICVCTLDLNRPDHPALQVLFLEQIARICRREQLGPEEVGGLFQSCYMGKEWRLSVERCWSYLKKALWPSASSIDQDVPVPGRPDCVWQVLELPGRTERIARLRWLLLDCPINPGIEARR